MYGNPQHRDFSEVQDLRRRGGRWLKERRERLGVSQRQLAERVGLEYYTLYRSWKPDAAAFRRIAMRTGRAPSICPNATLFER